MDADARVLTHLLVNRLTVLISAVAALALLLSRAPTAEAAQVENLKTLQAGSDEKPPQRLDIDFLRRLLPVPEFPAKPHATEFSKSDVLTIHPSGSLIAGLRPGVLPKRAAALHLEEKGRRLLLSGAYQSSLIYFEKALGIDSNPYVYYYLAKAHYHLAHIRESLQFLDVAANLLADQDDWMTEIDALRGKLLVASREMQHNIRPVTIPFR